jgi:hypothetical protein
MPACLRPYIPLRISRYTQPPSDIARKFYLVMFSSGMIDKGRRMYSYLDKGVPKFKKIISIIIISASSVDSVLFIRILKVVMSAVDVATSSV